jgi:DNA-directed RNA polymerase subunit M/transcription elongation factor TFIIS
MLKTRQILLTIGLAAAAAIFCSGCPAMMIPGLAYSGYKYEHDKNQPAASASTASTQNAKASAAKSNKATTAQRQKIPDSEIE